MVLGKWRKWMQELISQLLNAPGRLAPAIMKLQDNTAGSGQGTRVKQFVWM